MRVYSTSNEGLSMATYKDICNLTHGQPHSMTAGHQVVELGVVIVSFGNTKG